MFLWYVMWLTLSISYWLTLPVAILAAGFLVRVFIIFHDCGHGSFFKSPKANAVVGFIAGILCFVPFHHWRWEHAVHHGTAGDLDRRGMGAVWTLTVQEYLTSSRWKRFAYRLGRNPIVLFVIAPLVLFVVLERFPTPGASRRARQSVYWTNLALLLVAIGMSLLVGLKAYVLIQLTVTWLSGSAGIWLFYVQHQFEGVYWQRGEEWDATDAALQGSSFYKLPRILQWFSGNIGFHHLHHLSPRIPNYNLEACHAADPAFHSVPPLTLLKSLKSLTYRLWDEQQQRLVHFWHIRKLRRQPAGTQR